MNKNRKTKEYLKLHFKMVPWYAWLMTLASGICFALAVRKAVFPQSPVLLELEITVVTIAVVVACVFIFPAVDRICSTTLYQDQAFFYRCLPVTDVVTVGTKTMVTGLLTGLFFAGWFIAEFVMAGAGSPLVFLLLLLVSGSAGLLVGSIIIAGYKIGNNFRTMQKRKPNKVIAGLFILFFASCLLWALVKVTKLEIQGIEVKLLVTFLVTLAVSFIAFAGNIYSVKHSYDV